MIQLIAIIILGIIAWNIKKGFEMIGDKLDALIEQRKKDSDIGCLNTI